jgi:hypothetical protein
MVLHFKGERDRGEREGHRMYRERGGAGRGRERGTSCSVFVIIVIGVFIGAGTGTSRVIVIVGNFFRFSCPTTFEVLLY